MIMMAYTKDDAPQLGRHNRVVIETDDSTYKGIITSIRDNGSSKIHYVDYEGGTLTLIYMSQAVKIKETDEFVREVVVN